MVTPTVYADHGGHGLIILNADWLTRRQITHWLVIVRLCKQNPHGHCDVIGSGGILMDSPCLST